MHALRSATRPFEAAYALRRPFFLSLSLGVLMRPLVVLLVFLSILCAAPPATAACVEYACVTPADTTGDGVPDGASGGTTSFLEEAPTARFGLYPDGYFVGADGVLGDEHEGRSYAVDAGVGGIIRDSKPYAAYVYLDVNEVDGETGESWETLALLIEGEDADGDGIADLRCPTLAAPRPPVSEWPDVAALVPECAEPILAPLQ
jgi:hypothetical protein